MATLFSKAQAFEKRFVEAGGLLAAGVDPTGMGGALPGFGDQRNYELLLEAGFLPEEVVRIMTQNGARVLREDDRYGSVEPGKLADLVVIAGDPGPPPGGDPQRDPRLQGRRRLQLGRPHRIGEGPRRAAVIPRDRQRRAAASRPASVKGLVGLRRPARPGRRPAAATIAGPML